MLVFVVACSSTEETETASVQDMDALSQMCLAFEGSPSSEAIKALLDQVLPLYGLEANEENYSRVGSVLVTLRKESKVGITEMHILSYMAMSGPPPTNMEFPDMAALAFTALESSEDERRWFLGTLTATPG